MAVETIQQILAPDNAPYINRVRAQSRVAKALLENVFQGLVETNDKGVTDRFATEAEINGNAQIFVNRVLPVKMKPREQGASVNGGSFSANSHYTQTQTVSIEVLTIIDDTIIIPRSRQDWIDVDLLAKQTDIYSKRIATIVNGGTAAAKLFTTWNEERKGNEVSYKDITSTDVANKDVALRFLEANDLLDEGDTDHGVDVFPEDTRIAVFKVGTRALLKAAGVLVIGGSNAAQSILAGNGISEGAKKAGAENGYWGDIDGVPCHGISNESLIHASGFLGLPDNELKNGRFLGYLSSSYANARGVSTIDQVKVVDAVQGQGYILQPYTKCGFVSWYAKGNVIFTKDGYGEGLYKGLADIFSDIGTGAIALKLKAAGSRLWPTFTQHDIASSTITVKATALDDNNVDHIKAAHYLVTTTPVNSVEEFVHGCKVAGATHGACSLTTTTSVTVATNSYLSLVAISDDGSVSFYTVKKTA